MTAPLPLIAILDGGTAVTGSIIAAMRAATWLEEEARFLLILPEGSSAADALYARGLDVITAPLPMLRRSPASVLRYPLATLNAARGLKGLLEERSVQTLQVNDFYLLAGLLTRPLGWRGRIVTVVRIDVRRFGTIGRLWFRAARRWSDQLIGVSRFVARTAGLRSEDVIYDPAPPVTHVKRSATSPRLLFIGNYIPGKGQDTAIRAFHRIAVDFPNAELHFHGGDMGLQKNRAYLEELRRSAAEGIGADRIRFCGFAEDTSTLLASACVSLTLSESESFSLTCQEASARGIAVIATRCGGPEEIIDDGVSGFLVGIGDDAAVAERMAALMRDPDLARRMGDEGARLMAERFGVEPWRERMREVLALPGKPLQPATERKSSTSRGASFASE